ncbi:hypothetical protein AURDEDRAFT_154940 [Auricularia subglabra TFB-10046 SS5]|uniref:LITAF domain-containing protein n=1 Tax=Auricularia subglabra (strain TFB-10046 / SS5) TaxID=717982 RepID=J0D7J6_AURST|nr:hypothetical protein AURDEDRAFT_154940 [Auricularia subglabra TFB-10046 SS5]
MSFAPTSGTPASSTSTPASDASASTTAVCAPGVIEVSSLGSHAAPVRCPHCAATAVTRVEYSAGRTTRVCAVATSLLLSPAAGFVPYLIDGTKDKKHFCGSCGTLLAVWHRSGRLEIAAEKARDGEEKEQNGALMEQMLTLALVQEGAES